MRTRVTLISGGFAAVVVVASAVGGGVGFASGGARATCSVPSQYSTIQAAVNATSCKTIKVAAGTYAENVSIGRGLTLLGAKAGKDARNPRGGGESVINGGAAANITVTADDVTIDGFTLNGPVSQGTAALVMQNGNRGETVQNTIFNNPGRAASITTSKTVFRKNAVRNTATAGDGFQTNSMAVRDVVITGNSFSGPKPAKYNADVTFIEGNANLTVTDNRSTGNGTLVALFKTNGAKVTGNTVVGVSTSSAVYVGGGNKNIEVSGNTISAAGSAVKVANDFAIGTNSGVSITRNTLRNNQYGVNVGPSSTTDVVRANRNTITGNAVFGVSNSPTSGAPANATCNWWGSLSGPSGAGSGKGDKVSAGVTYKPWLKLSNLVFPCQ